MVEFGKVGIEKCREAMGEVLFCFMVKLNDVLKYYMVWDGDGIKYNRKKTPFNIRLSCLGVYYKS